LGQILNTGMMMHEVSVLPASPDFYCSELSRQMNEPMAGTAVHATTWLLLEYNREWAARATEENALPPPVQTWLHEQVMAVENGRLQFIKQTRAGGDEQLNFFVAIVEQNRPRLYRFQLNRYEALLDVDIPAIIAGEEGHYTEPLFLVCTNGRRDRCCAKFGLTFYHALAARLGQVVWQTTHLGGHRFAATMLALPVGVNYGRLAPQDVDQLIATHQRGDIWLPKLRGHTGLAPVAQVADAHLRRETGQMRLEAFRHESTQQLADDRWRVRFVETAVGKIHHILIEAGDPLHVYASSGKMTTKAVPQFQFVAHDY
jgi:hypothetical protein